MQYGRQNIENVRKLTQTQIDRDSEDAAREQIDGSGEELLNKSTTTSPSENESETQSDNQTDNHSSQADNANVKKSNGNLTKEYSNGGLISREALILLPEGGRANRGSDVESSDTEVI